LAALATLSVVTGTFLAAGTVLAVHDEAFQLDGDTAATTQTNIPPNGPQTLDWDSMFTPAGAPKATLPTGFKDAGFELDFKTNTNGSFNTSDNSTYATGSKDTLPISGWQCNQDNNVNSKIDVMNATPPPTRVRRATISSTSPSSATPIPVPLTWGSGSSRARRAASRPAVR